MESMRKNRARQVLLENFDFLVNICAKVNFWKLDIRTISELRMKKWVPKSECTQKIEWDKFVLTILTFWSRSRVHLVKAFSLSLFLIYLFYLFIYFCRRFGPGQVSRSVRVNPGRSGQLGQSVVGSDVIKTSSMTS